MSNRDVVVLEIVIFFCLLALLALQGCVRSVTVCTTFDHSLGRADPNSGLARNNAGASVCTEMGPPQ